MTHLEGFFQRSTEERIPLRGEQVDAPAGEVHVPIHVPAPVGDGALEHVLARARAGGQVRGPEAGPALLLQDALPVVGPVRPDRGAGAGPPGRRLRPTPCPAPRAVT